MRVREESTSRVRKTPPVPKKFKIVLRVPSVSSLIVNYRTVSDFLRPYRNVLTNQVNLVHIKYLVHHFRLLSRLLFPSTASLSYYPHPLLSDSQTCSPFTSYRNPQPRVISTNHGKSIDVWIMCLAITVTTSQS